MRLCLSVRDKFSSERGASLSMALLLFLVCVMVSSVVLSASTMAAGRVSGLRTSSAANSALLSSVGLFSDMLSGDGVTVEVLREADVVRSRDGSYALASDPHLKFTVDGVEDFGIYEPVYASDSTLFETLALDWLFGTSGDLSEMRSVNSSFVLSSLDLSSDDVRFSSDPSISQRVDYSDDIDVSLSGIGTMSHVGVGMAVDGTLELRFSSDGTSDAVMTCPLVVDDDTSMSLVSRDDVAGTAVYRVSTLSRLTWSGSVVTRA